MTSLLPSFSSTLRLDEGTIDHEVHPEGGQNVDLSVFELISGAGRRIPMVNPNALEHDKALGFGSYGVVSRALLHNLTDPDWSPYWVAVKRIREGLSARELSQRCGALAKELRVSSHESLRNHPFLTPTLGYGWEQDSQGPARPFLIIEYSDEGTIADYLQRIQPDIQERRDFALDAARGVEALHDCKIIHGDLNPKNIIVSACWHESRVTKARLADFGTAVFESDAGTPSYLGTLLYNAPEFWSGRASSRDAIQTFKAYYAADIYSLGLSTWTIMNCGQPYVKSLTVEGPKAFLERLYDKGQDELLALSIEFCQSAHFNKFESTAEVIKEVFGACLRENPADRSNIADVVRILSKGASSDIPLSPFPSIKSGVSVAGTRPLTTVRDPLTQLPYAIGHAAHDETLVLQVAFSHSQLRASMRAPQIGADEKSQPESKWVTVVQRPRVARMSEEQMWKLDIFELSMVQRVPFHIQEKLVQRFKNDAQTAKSKSRRAHALLQLGVCYFLGFGIPQNTPTFLELLQQASDSDYTARALLTPIYDALSSEASIISRDMQKHKYFEDQELLEPNSQDAYFGARLRYHQRQKRQILVDSLCRFRGEKIDPYEPTHVAQIVERLSYDRPPEENCFQIQNSDGSWELRPIIDHLASIGATASLRKIFEIREAWDGRELTAGLSEACKYGQLDSAKVLATECIALYVDDATPCPLHWLIMLEPADAKVMLDLLLLPRASRTSVHDSLCGEFIDHMPQASSGTFYFPEHCMQLFGSPLHWAVRTRNLLLIEGLLEHGAIIDHRWNGERRYFGDVDMPPQRATSPLDLAVQYHMPDVVDLLLSKKATFVGGPTIEEGYSSLFMIGHECLPLSRYVIHRHAYAQSLRQTLHVITEKYGHDINWRGHEGYTALLAALTELNQEKYIIEELMRAGARADLCTDTGDNVAFIIATSAAKTPMQKSTLELVLSKVENPNALSAKGIGYNKERHNALHYCALLGNKQFAETLLNSSAVLVDFRTSSNATALHKAATMGHTDVVRLLLANGADPTATDDSGYTALELAVSRRHVEIALELLKTNAPTTFRYEDGSPKSTVLHAASSGPSNFESILEPLLRHTKKLQHVLELNSLNFEGYTPLHKAACFGDVKGVQTLIEFGADVLKVSARPPQSISRPQSVISVTEEMISRAQTNTLGKRFEKITANGVQVHEVKRLMQRYTEILRTLRRAEAVAKGRMQSPAN